MFQSNAMIYHVDREKPQETQINISRLRPSNQYYNILNDTFTNNTQIKVTLI